MTYFAQEKDFQHHIEEVLLRGGYSALALGGPHVSAERHEELLYENMRACVERLNDRLLTSTEFDRLRSSISSLSSTKAFDLFRQGLVINDDEGKALPLLLFDAQHAERNTYQSAREVRVYGQGQQAFNLDFVLYVNGLPLTNIEVKASSREPQEAVSQINRYTHLGAYTFSLYSFIENFGVSNGVVSQYFCLDPRVEQGGTYGDFVFTWKNERNQQVDGGEMFSHLYDPTFYHRVLSRYLVKRKDGVIIMHRPHQIFATEAVRARLLTGEKRTFVAHATGSGKTLTSFSCGEAILRENLAEVLVVVLDRNDLGSQTLSEYVMFGMQGTQVVSKNSQNELHRALHDSTVRQIITTAQSLDKYLQRHADNPPRRIAFLVDEAHRSTNGEMFQRLRHRFPNSIMVGFTGTPLRREAVGARRHTTEELFGECAHEYSIAGAIEDRSVLPFKPHLMQVEGYASPVVGEGRRELSVEEAKAALRSPERLKASAHAVAQSFMKLSGQEDKTKTALTGGFSAMLAANSKTEALHYYEYLRREFAQQQRRVAIVFSVADNCSHEALGKKLTEQEWAVRIMRDYDAAMGTSYAAQVGSGFSELWEQYERDAMGGLRNGDVDLMIVVDKLLTGFDAPQVNTLYLDKDFSKENLHSIVQAASRTNRVAEGKSRGNIVSFSDRDILPVLEEAVLLYSGSAGADQVLDRRSFEESVQALQTALVPVLPFLQNSDQVAEDVLSGEDAREQVRVLSTALSTFRKVFSESKMYTEWDSSFEEQLGFSREQLERAAFALRGMYERLRKPGEDRRDTSEELVELEFLVTGLLERRLIDERFIYERIRKYAPAPPSVREEHIRALRELVEASGDASVRKQRVAYQRVIAALEAGEVGAPVGPQGEERSLLEVREEIFARIEVEKRRLWGELVAGAAEEFRFSPAEVEAQVQRVLVLGAPGEDFSSLLKRSWSSFGERRAKKAEFLSFVQEKFW